MKWTNPLKRNGKGHFGFERRLARRLNQYGNKTYLIMAITILLLLYNFILFLL